jgi:cystathionine beta-lyase
MNGLSGKYDFDRRIDRRGSGCKKWDALKDVFGREDLLPFWIADMDFASPPEVVEALAARARQEVFGYPVRLSSACREAVAGWETRRHDWKVEPGWVTRASGVVAGLSLALRALTEPGDEVIIQPPIYAPFFDVIARNGRTVAENPLVRREGRYVMDLDDLARRIGPRTKAILLCSPHNPVMRVWERDELAALADLCTARGIWILADEIWQDFIYRPYRHVPMASLSEEVARRTLTFVAPSKTFNLAGLYASAAIIPDPTARAAYERVLEGTAFGGAHVFAQTAMEAAYTLGEPWLAELLAYLEDNRSRVREWVAATPGLSMDEPEGTYVYWLDFRGVTRDPAEIRRLLVDRARVALNDGTTFGTGGGGFARLNMACPRGLLDEGLERIASALTERG